MDFVIGDSYVVFWIECVFVLELDVGKIIEDMFVSVLYVLGDINLVGMLVIMMYDGVVVIIIVYLIWLIIYCVYVMLV